MAVVTNLNLVRNAFTKSTATLDTRARMARDEIMMTLIQLAQEEIKGERPKDANGKYTKATPGEPPMNRTGNLRRSIRGEKTRVGFGTYSAIVGPTVIYGRAVELGGQYAPPSWNASNGAIKGFPYMTPAYLKFQKAGLINKIFAKHMSA